MEHKFFNIRDSNGVASVLAIKLFLNEESEVWNSAGYEGREWLMLIKLDDNRMEMLASDWDSESSIQLAHSYIENNWDLLPPDAEIDCQTIRGEFKKQ